MIRKQQQMVSVMVDISYWSIDTWKHEISADATSPGSEDVDIIEHYRLNGLFSKLSRNCD